MMVWNKRSWAGVLGALVTVSCSPMPRPPENMEPHLPTSPPKVEVADDNDKPQKIEPIGAVACSFDAHPAAQSLTFDLKVRRDALSGVGQPTEIQVRHASATLAFPVGDSAAVGAAVDTADAHLEGFVGRQSVHLFARPTHKLAGGTIVPGSKTQLELVSAEAGSLRMHVMTGDLLTLSESAKYDTMPCADLDTVPPADTPLSSGGKEVSLDAKKGLDIHAAPLGDPTVTLHVPEAAVDLPVEAIELLRKDKMVFVEIEANSSILSGWVSPSAVHRRAKPQYGLIGLTGTGSPSDPRTAGIPVQSKREGVVCKVAVDFAAPESQAEKAKLVWVGTVKPEAIIVDHDADDAPPHAPSPYHGWKRIDVRDVSANVSLYARQTVIDTCLKKL